MQERVQIVRQLMLRIARRQSPILRAMQIAWRQPGEIADQRP